MRISDGVQTCALPTYHADRHRRHHILQPVGRRVRQDVRSDLLHHRLLRAVHRTSGTPGGDPVPPGKESCAMTAIPAQATSHEPRPIVEVEAVSKIYPGGTEALNHVTLDFPEGDRKSTRLNSSH